MDESREKDVKDEEKSPEPEEGREEEPEEAPEKEPEPKKSWLTPALAKPAKAKPETKEKKEEKKEEEAEQREDEDEEVLKAREEKAQANEELLKTRERMLRIAADYENFRKRSKKDVEEAEHKARVDILKEMLPVFDNLARAVEHGGAVKDIEPIIQGARMVTKQFEENLARFGLKRIESVGKVFDPTVHDAIAQEESDEAEPGTIIKEFLAGYMLGDKLLRAAMVVVAKAGKAGGTAPAGEEEKKD